MRIHEIPGDPSRGGKRKRVGRGESSGYGKSAGRGTKGAQSRAGASKRKGFEGGQMPLVRRVPKRGFTNPRRRIYTPVNLGVLEARFDAGGEVDPQTLCEKGIIHKSERLVKILGRGDLTKNLHIKAHAFSKGARGKIEAKGGKCEVI